MSITVATKQQRLVGKRNQTKQRKVEKSITQTGEKFADVSRFYRWSRQNVN